MSNGHMLVTFGAVEQAAADTDSVAAQIAQELEDLKAYLAPLVATWEGTASGDWQSLQNRWNTSASDLNAILRQIASNLRIAASNYVNAENTNASIWG
jgi:early secretory antigenic target protein ESAT-6